jgi:hypothetical protein
MLQVAGVDANGIEHLSFGGSRKITFLIEACLGKHSEIGSQKILNRLLSDDAVETAVESDNSPDGALFSRLHDNGTVTDGHPAAADSVAYVGYRGQTPTTVESGVTFLLATWAVEVVT